MKQDDELSRQVRRRRLSAARRYRGRRLWRTISRRRRLVGMVGLLVLVTGFAAGYYFTRPYRVQRLAESYLTDLTGRQVKIDSAAFSPFSGIRLAGVRVLPPADPAHGYLPGEQDAIFKADEVLMELEQTSLLTGRLKVRRIVALRPTLTRLDEDGKPSYLRRQGRWDLAGLELPLIELREGKCVAAVRTADGGAGAYMELPVNLRLWPDARTAGLYHFDSELGGATGDPMIRGVRGTLTLDPLAFDLEAPFVVESAEQLPAWIAQKLKEYSIDVGSVTITDVRFQDNLSVAEVDCRDSGMSLAPLGYESINLTRVRGRLRMQKRVFASKPGEQADAADRIDFIGIAGQLNGQPFEMNGRYGGFGADAPFRVVVACRQLDLPADGQLAKQIGGLAEKFWHEFQPAGRLDVEVIVERQVRGGPTQFLAKLDCQDVAMSYFRYPYRVEHLAGRVTLDNDKVTLANLAGQRGQARVSIDGWLKIRRSWEADFTIRAIGLPFDQALIDCLKVGHGPVVDAIGQLGIAGGSADFECRIVRSASPGSEYRPERLAITLHDVPARPAAFPYPVKVVSGCVDLDGQTLRLNGFQLRPAHAGEGDPNGVVLLDGMVGLHDGGKLELKLVSPSLPLDDVLWSAFAADVSAEVKRFNIAGRASMAGTICREGAGQLSFDVHGSLIGGRMKYDQLPYELTELSGRVLVNGRRIELDNVRGRHGASTISASGSIGLDPAMATRLVLRSDRLALDEDLRAALPEAGRKTWSQFSPSGAVALDAILTQPAAQVDGPRPPMTHVITLTALGSSIRYVDFPWPVDRLTGQIVIRPDRVELIDVQAERDGQQVVMSGTVWPGRDNRDLPTGAEPLPQIELKIDARQLRFDEAMRKALPWRLRAKWNDMLPTGRFDLAMGRLRYVPLGDSARWDFDGRMDLRNVHAQLGLRFENVTGTIIGRGMWVTGQPLGLVGRMELASVGVLGRTVSQVRGQVVLDARNATLRMDGLTGVLCGGHVSGSARTEMESGDYAASLSVRAIDLNKLINEGRPSGRKMDVAGLLDGRISIGGSADGGRRRGQGEVQISRAKIYPLPPFLQVFNAYKVHETSAPAQSANIVFHFGGDEVTLDQAVLRDPAVSLMGTGRLDISKGRIEATLVGGEPSPRQRRGGWKALEELFAGAGKELMEYRVSGPYDKPAVEPVSMHSLRDAISALTAARARYNADKQSRGARD